MGSAMWGLRGIGPGPGAPTVAVPPRRSHAPCLCLVPARRHRQRGAVHRARRARAPGALGRPIRRLDLRARRGGGDRRCVAAPRAAGGPPRPGGAGVRGAVGGGAVGRAGGGRDGGDRFRRRRGACRLHRGGANRGRRDLLVPGGLVGGRSARPGLRRGLAAAHAAARGRRLGPIGRGLGVGRWPAGDPALDEAAAGRGPQRGPRGRPPRRHRDGRGREPPPARVAQSDVRRNREVAGLVGGRRRRRRRRHTGRARRRCAVVGRGDRGAAAGRPVAGDAPVWTVDSAVLGDAGLVDEVSRTAAPGAAWRRTHPTGLRLGISKGWE